MFARFDGGVIHIHGNGRHLLPAASTLEGLKAIYLGDDKGFPPAFEVLAELRDKAGAVPLVAGVAYPQFREALAAGTLTGGVLYRVSGVPDVAAANRCMARVRDLAEQSG